jgi:signal transduction histidine kinase
MMNREQDSRSDLERLRATNETLQTINALTDELFRTADLRTLARRAVRAMMQYSESPSVSLFLHHEDTGELELLHTRRLTDETTDTIRRHPTTGTLSGQAVTSHEVIVCPNMQTEPSVSAAIREAARSEGVECGISIPLLFEDRVLGAINLIFQGPRHVPDSERDTLRSIGQTIGLAVANALHVDRIETEIRQRRAAEAELQTHRDHLEELVTARTDALARALDRAQESDRLKSEFLATISHELRTPLNSILGFTTTVLDGMAGALNEEQSRQLGFVQTSAKHLLALINDLIDLSQIEAGKMELALEEIDLPAVIEEAVDTIGPRARDKGLVVGIDTCTDPCRLVSDRRRVAQVLLNLVDNAVKFTDSGKIRIACRCDEDTVHVAVSDDGAGITLEDQAALFVPFRQLDASASRTHTGSGLGLSICKKLVTLLGGEIGVDSEPGCGATFHFTLPIRPPANGSA